MIWYLIGGAIAFIACVWGIGLALLVLPDHWRRFWPALCPACGLALQSLVVWIAAKAGFPGIHRWALPATLVPVLLLGLATVRVGGLRRLGTLISIGARNFWPQWLVMTVCFVVLVYPFTRPPADLTAISIGSCDAADYAAGGRVLEEFARSDRMGFMAESDVTRVGSAPDFYEFWLRLNHFIPSALLALNGALLGRQSYELASLLGVVLHVLSLPSVFWLARAGFRLRSTVAGIVVVLYAFNPILLYAVYQTALGQLLGAPAVALLTWVGMCAFRAARRRRDWQGRQVLWAWSGLFLVCHWLILGAYNFVLLFCYAPLFGWVGAQVLLGRRSWRVALRWLGMIAVQVGLGILLFSDRALTIIERIFLFQSTAFGWNIPRFGPAGWLGIFADEKLHPIPFWMNAAIAAALFLALAFTGFGVLRHVRERTSVRVTDRWLLSGAFLLSAFSGYAILLGNSGANGTYNAYKLFCIFYPGTLIALCLWLDPWRSRDTRRFGVWLPSGVLALVLFGYELVIWPQFNHAIRYTGLVLGREMRDTSRVESLPEVKSVNVCLDVYWQRLWANALLLRLPQYFSLPTYEARHPTELRGAWDLRNHLLSLRTQLASDTIELNASFYLVRRSAPAWVDLEFGTGWFPAEQRRNEQWCWGGSDAEIKIFNPHTYPVRAVLWFRGWTMLDHRLLNVEFVPPIDASQSNPVPQQLWSGVVGDYYSSSSNIPLQIPPGQSRLIFRSPQLARKPTADDPRPLMFALKQLQLDELEPDTAEATVPR